MYHKKTVAYRDHFFPHVRQCSPSSSFTNIFRKWENRGRVLLLVYPPPGSMAALALDAYRNVDPIWNDTIIYVGEGRGGVNADDMFSDMLEESGQYILEAIQPVSCIIRYERV
jgi:hypothetical protein